MVGEYPNGSKIYGLKYENEIEGIICIARTNDIPYSVKELDMMSELAHIKDEGKIAIAYTVWSRKRGAGKEIINKVLEFAKAQGIERVVTLLPLHLWQHISIYVMVQNKLVSTTQHRILNMQFEYEDYRKKPSNPWMGIWPRGKCPVGPFRLHSKTRNLSCRCSYLFGLYFTALGLLTNFLLIDYFVYRSTNLKLIQMWGDKDE